MKFPVYRCLIFSFNFLKPGFPLTGMIEMGWSIILRYLTYFIKFVHMCSMTTFVSDWSPMYRRAVTKMALDSTCIACLCDFTGCNGVDTDHRMSHFNTFFLWLFQVISYHMYKRVVFGQSMKRLKNSHPSYSQALSETATSSSSSSYLWLLLTSPWNELITRA